MTVTAYIGLGSNLNDPLKHVESACTHMNAHPKIYLARRSSWYRSHAVGPGDQPDYINGVAEITTELDAFELLQALQAIEHEHGRVRIERWGARTLDLDLLWYNNQQIDHPLLQVPHPRISQRNFVLLPLNEVAPDITLADGQSIANLSGAISTEGIWPL